MAQEEKKDTAPVKEQKAEVKYFKNLTHAGGGVHLGFTNPDDPTTEQRVKFVKYVYKVRGEDVFEGYLETSDPKAIKLLQEDRYAEEIQKSEYDKALKDGRQVV